MGSDLKRDADMDRLLRAALKPASQASASPCPEPGVLAALLEGNLSANEQSALDAHIVECGRCQETLAILAHELPGEQTEPVAPAETGWFTWVTTPRLRWLVPISAVATVAVVFFATRPLIAPEGDVPGSEVIRMAQAPTPPPEVPQAGLDEFREKPAAAAEKSELAGAPERERTTPALAGQPSGATGVPGPRADNLRAPAGKPARDEKAADPAAEMIAARAALEEKRAQATAPAALPVAPAPPAAQAAAAPPPAAGQMAVAQPAADVRVQESVVRKEAVAEKDRPARAGGAPAKLVRSLEGGPVTIREPGGAVVWRVGAGGQIARSDDGGATWQPQASGVTADLLAGSAPSQDVCWIVGSAGTVLITTDGRRWQRRPFPERADLAAVSAADARSATVLTRDGRRFETLDGGLTWSPTR